MLEALPIWIAALSLTLLQFLWQGLAIGVLALMALVALKNARPQARYAVAASALLACPLALVLTFAGALDLYDTLKPAPFQESLRAGSSATQLADSPSPAAILAGLAPADPALAPWLVALWAAGSGLMFLRLGLGLVFLRRLRRQLPAPPEWQARLDALAARMGLGQVVLLLMDGLGSPLTTGWWRPIVLVPAGLLTRLPVPYIEALLAHELAHIRRHDYLINLIQVTIEALLFYHPVVWWLSQQIRIEREHLADQLATTVIPERRPLALALAALAELQSPNPPQLAQAGSGGRLKTRIELLLAPQPQAQRLAAFVLTLLGLATATFGLLATVRFADIAPEKSPIAVASKDRLSYALVRSDREGILAWGPDDEIDQVALKLPRRTTDFILVRRNGRDSLVFDDAFVTPLRRAWEQAEALEAEAAAFDESLRKRHSWAQQLTEQIAESTADTAALAELDRESRELTLLESRSAKLYREQNLAFERVERRLRDVIASAPSIALESRRAHIGPP